MKLEAVLPGWFGKLPGMGDFAYRRLPEAFRSVWDQWLQHGLARLRERHTDWTTHYLEAPIWFFVLGRRTATDRCWIGILMPSVDGVGRYFPFTLAVEIDDVSSVLEGNELRAVQQWWATAAQVALQALDSDLDALRVDALLRQRFSDDQDGVVALDAQAVLTLPVAGASLWFSDPNVAGGARVSTDGLPRGSQFDMLFGCDFDAVTAMEGAS